MEGEPIPLPCGEETRLDNLDDVFSVEHDPEVEVMPVATVKLEQKGLVRRWWRVQCLWRALTLRGRQLSGKSHLHC